MVTLDFEVFHALGYKSFQGRRRVQVERALLVLVVLHGRVGWGVDCACRRTEVAR